MKKFLRLLKQTNNEKGIAIPIAIGFVVLVIVSGMFVPQFIEQNKGLARKFNDDYKMEVLAKSSLEIGKYLLFYEKAFFLDNALKQPLDANGKNVFDTMVSGTRLWGDVCGDAGFSSNTTMSYEGSHTFCPLKIRDPFLSGTYIENFLFDFTDEVLPEDRFSYDPISGAYHLGPVYLSPKGGTDECGTNAPDTSDETNSHMFHMNIEPKLKCYLDNDEGGYEKSIALDYYFYGKSASFTSYGSERYIKIIATVNYRAFNVGNIKAGSIVNKRAEEALMFQTTTMKDFALFFPYPHKNDGNTVQSVNFNDTVKVSSQSVVNGKTFFRGNISLPVDTDGKINTSDFADYNDAVVLTGTSLENIPPTDYNISQIKKKFKKGIMPNFGEHLMYDTPAVTNKTSGLKTKYINGSFNLEDVDINTYVTHMVNRTECSKTIDELPQNGIPRKDVKLLQSAQALDPYNCKNFGIWSDTRYPLFGGGLHTITVNRSETTPTFVLAPSHTLRFDTPKSNFIGVYVGGYLDAANSEVNFYSLLNVKRGIPGISDWTDVTIINKESQDVQAGVGVPLRNLVFVLEH